MCFFKANPSAHKDFSHKQNRTKKEADYLISKINQDKICHMQIYYIVKEEQKSQETDRKNVTDNGIEKY